MNNRHRLFFMASRLACYLSAGLALSSCGIQDSLSVSAIEAAASASGCSTSATAVYLFITSNPSNGALGGRAGADAICEAEYATNFTALGCTKIHAFLSVSASDEIRDMPTNYCVPTTLPILRPTGVVIANQFSEMIAGAGVTALTNAPDGVMLGCWTGSEGDGAIASTGWNCNGWTSGALADRGGSGGTAFLTSQVILAQWDTCSTATRRLYCLCW